MRKNRPRPPGSRPTTKVGECVVCGTEFKHRQVQQVTCSRECGSGLSARWRLAIRVMMGPTEVEIMCPLNWRTCGDCGVQWVRPPGRNDLTCDRCKAERVKAYYRDIRKPKGGFGLRPLRCATCGKEWLGHGRKGDAYCSPACHKRSPGYRAGRKLHALRRGGRLKSAEVERFTSEEIWERDGYRCGICLRKLAMDKAVPHPLAPTIDHIVPIANGGGHTRANVQAAHFQCNALRSNRGAAQLRLA